MDRVVEADYLVVGAGAMGMAFTDALIDHADVRVALVDRRHGVGGHWLEAYPFVRLHQASAFYGVASTLLGGGAPAARARGGPARAGRPAGDLRLLRASAASGCSASGQGRVLPQQRVRRRPRLRLPRSRASGTRCRSAAGSSTPATSPRASRRRRRPRSASPRTRGWCRSTTLARLEEAPSQYVVVGSGKTATDACIWLLARGVDPDAICWVRPRDPWMLNRAAVQPDPAIFLGMVADTMQAAEAATSLDDLFLRLEDAGHHAAHRPLGHARRWPRRPPSRCGSSSSCAPSRTSYDAATSHGVSRGRLDFADGSVAVAAGRPGRALRGGRPEVSAARPDLAAGGDHAAADPGRLPVLRRRAQSATSRRPGTTTRRRTGSARPRRCRTPWPTGRGCRSSAPGTRCRSTRPPDIKAWGRPGPAQPGAHSAGLPRVPRAGRRHEPLAEGHDRRT